MNFALDTALLCLLGWASHWFFSWGEQWKLEKKSLLDFLDDNPPAFWFSLSSTAAVYMIGPSVLAATGINLPTGLDVSGAKYLMAFAVGYMSDSLVYKLANVIRK